jgi:EmrB/QacA subfamily drug resistance transporter
MDAAATRPQEPTAPAYNPRRWLALLVTLAAAFMDLVDVTVVLVALPSIERTLGAGEAALQWTMAGYTLTFALLLVTGGRLGDIAGRKRVFTTGLAGFTLASLLAGVAPSAGMLLGARVLQGGMAALMVPQVLSFIQVEFPPSERARAISVYGMTFALGGVSGPLLGGLLLHADLFGWAWRPIFLINLPIGIAALAGATRLLRESKSAHAPRVDPGGAVLVTLGLLALLYPLVQGHELNWPAWTFASMAASVPLLALFLIHQRRKAARGGSPLLDPVLFRHRGALGGLLVALVFFSGNGFNFVLTLLLQDGLRYSALATALTFLPFPLGVMMGSGAAMQLVPRLGRKLVIAGGPVMALGVLLMITAVARYGDALQGWQLAPGQLVAGLGMALVASTLVNVVLARVPATQAGAASGLVNTSIQIGIAAGIALIGTILFSLLSGGDTFVTAATRSLWVSAGLFVGSAALSFLLPPGRVQAGQHDTQPAAEPEPTTPSTA